MLRYYYSRTSEIRTVPSEQCPDLRIIMSGLGRCPDLRNPDLGGSTVIVKDKKHLDQRNGKKRTFESDWNNQHRINIEIIQKLRSKNIQKMISKDINYLGSMQLCCIECSFNFELSFFFPLFA